MKNWVKQNWVLLLIILIGVGFRYVGIGHLPAGLFPDEAAYGMDGRSVTHGDFQPFYERGNGREGLFMYFLAAAISIFGYHPWANHLVSASFGLGALIAGYFLARQMFGRRVAMLSAFFMAVSSYAVTMTRTAFRANTLPLFSTLTLLFAIKIFDETDPRKKSLYAVLSGLFFGLGFYTYISFRMMLPLFFGFAVLLLFAFRSQLRWVYETYKKPVIYFILAFILAFSWIGYYFFVSHPGSFVGRAGQVSIFSPALNNGDVVGTFVTVVKKTVLSYFTEGDLNWRHNVSSYPFLSPFLSPFFAVAVLGFIWQFLIMLKQVWQKNLQRSTVIKSVLVFWFLFMLVPEVTTAEGIPHGLRLIGTIPAIFILSAYMVNWLWVRLKIWLPVKSMALLIASVFIGGIFVYNFYLYFYVAANSPDYYYSFRSDLTEVSAYINERNSKDKTYLSLDAFSVQTVDYLTTPTSQPYILLVPENSYKTPLTKGDQIIFTQSTLPDAEKYKQTFPAVKEVDREKNRFGQTIMIVYEKP
ncbi:MAG: ArnT family glycosyltransferase [Acidobacteriaceae bacterium]